MSGVPYWSQNRCESEKVFLPCRVAAHWLGAWHMYEMSKWLRKSGGFHRL